MMAISAAGSRSSHGASLVGPQAPGALYLQPDSGNANMNQLGGTRNHDGLQDLGNLQCHAVDEAGEPLQSHDRHVRVSSM